ncbi:MAG: Ig-like domain-containing protein [Deltaproteobacteria bacterium]
MSRKTLLFLKAVLFAALMILVPSLSYAANTYTATVASGTDVTMQDAGATIPITITNTSPSGSSSIREIEFLFDPAKYSVSLSTVAPTGWCVDKVDSADGQIVFRLIDPTSGKCEKNANGYEIAPGAAVTFNIIATPATAASDVANDTVLGITIKTPGSFTRSGGLPVWTRRALEASMTATPSSTGTSGVITLEMQVTNRSSGAQSTIGTTPSPPSASSGIVSFLSSTGGPFYGSTILATDITDTALTINVASTSGFPASGSMQIDSEKILYSGLTATSFSVTQRGYGGTTSASHTANALAYDLTPFSLAASGSSGDTKTITWKYQANGTGTGEVYFSARANNSALTAQSRLASSNVVVIGSFTAEIDVSPASVVSGQQVTVTMTATNNGGSALVGITPTLAVCAGGATETLAGGPSPSSVSSLAAGASTVFSWTYTITGSPGNAFCFTGSASASGPLYSNTASSNSGSVSKYSGTVSPSTIVSGVAPQTFTWSVYNGGACALERVEIEIPLQGGSTWNYSSASAAGWTISLKNGPDRVRFTDPNKSILFPAGATRSFSITFSSTETVTADKDVSFPVTVREAKTGGLCNSGIETSFGTDVTVTANSLSLSHAPASGVYADGSSYYTFTATLLSGVTPLAGKTINFTTTNGTLSASYAVTDSNGQATLTLTAPFSETVDISSTVTATYLSSTASDAVIFLKWTKPNIEYWGGLVAYDSTCTTLAPSIDCGASYCFKLNAKNTSSTSSMTLQTNSYFSFNDSSAGGTSEFKAYLDSSGTITPGGTSVLTFSSPTSSGGGGGVTVDSNFTAGSYLPTANTSPPPASGLYFTDNGSNAQYRSVTDTVTIAGSCGATRVNVIEWFELR